MGVLLSKIDNIKKLEEKSLSTRDKLFSTTLAISCPKQYNCHVNTGRPFQAALGWMADTVITNQCAAVRDHTSLVETISLPSDQSHVC